MKRIKWENIVFIILSSCCIYNAFSIKSNVLETLAVQIGIFYMLSLGIKYIRTNWEQVKQELKSIVLD